jgi:hypothetical protein
MSSKRAQRRSGCKGKRRFADATEAEAARHALGDRRQMNSYRCRFCGFWHIGHTPAKVRQAIRARRNG